jgi:Heparinase II/III-like protein/Heparinase II/III N-terminus
MIPRTLARVAQMDRAELVWRAGAGARIARDRAAAAVRQPRWDRRRLRSRLASGDGLDDVRRALGEEQWHDAHRALSRYFVTAPQRFPLSQSRRRSIVDSVRAWFPDGVRQATVRADRILAGEYDLLGYHGLRFDATPLPDRPDPPDLPGLPVLPDWHFDPVHHRRAPRRFWSTVKYLDPECGDHKIIWELNRHQHWLALGRAYWLSNDARYRDRFRAELVSWLDQNPPFTGINWGSMLELALRSVSWLWALHFFVTDPDSTDRDEEPWTVDLLLAIDGQLTHVQRNLSRYFSPNTHLLGEGLGLYVAGRAIPELAASRQWETIGRHVLVTEIERQIGRDGGHCERSTHYHRYALDFYILALVVARLTRDSAASDFERAVTRLAVAARLLVPDCGRLPHIGDDDGGSLFPMAGRPSDDIRDTLSVAAAAISRPDLAIGPAPEESVWLLGPESQQESNFHSPNSECRISSAALPDMGYYISRSREGDHLLVDGGPHGYQNGGHAHADALSLTLTVRGWPLLVDPGTYCYTTDPRMRDRLRSSALHNTLTLDHRSQSIPCGPFHWSHVANGRVHCWRTNEHFDYFDGSHDGYRPARHRRRVLALHGELLVIADYVDAAGPHTAAVHWHVHPDWHVDVDDRRVTFTRRRTPSAEDDGRGGAAGSLETMTLMVPEGVMDAFRGDRAAGLGVYSPVYGQLAPSTTIRVSHSATGPFWMAGVFDLCRYEPVNEVEWLRVSPAAAAPAHAAMLRIGRADSVDYVMFAEPLPAGTPGRVEAASATSPSPIWRAGDLETDARMLFARIDRAGCLTRLGLVDGSVVRDAAGRTHVALPERAPDWHLDQVPDYEFQIPNSKFQIR